MDSQRLKHLVVIPKGGLGNRLRVIASAKRLCRAVGANCTVIWNPAIYFALFQAEESVEVLASIPEPIGKRYHRRKTLLDRDGGNPRNRKVAVNLHEGIILESCHVFCGDFEEPIGDWDLRSMLPVPSCAVRESVESFKHRWTAFRFIGFHIRRTDNLRAQQYSPDNLFVNEAEALVSLNEQIFLATDNLNTEREFLKRFPSNIVVVPKFSGRDKTWPRSGDLAVDWSTDYVDLILLSECEYVLGSAKSSFSAIAITLNGSPMCRVLL